eukprot:UN0365
MFYASYFYNPNTWFSGILLGIFLMAIAFMGYVLPLVNNGFSLSFFFLSFLSYLWIGAQFPQEKFLSYARILTLYYYFLLMCILF